MAALINAIFGTYPDVDQQNNTTNQTVVESSTETTGQRLHTSAVAEDVQVKSVISSETQANAALNNKPNIDKLLSQLSTTHSQIDQYSRAKTSEINEQARQSIENVLAKTQRRQEELLLDANQRHLVIDNKYKVDLQKAVEALDAVKAKALADLEHDLHDKQQTIMHEAKQEIDIINEQANAAKLHALVEAQEQASKDINQLTNEMAASGQLDAQSLLQSKTTTIITSQSQATGIIEADVVVPVAEHHTLVASKGPSGSVSISTTERTSASNPVEEESSLTTTETSSTVKTKKKNNKH